MQRDLDDSQWQAFAEHAHELKGAAHTVGATTMAWQVESLDARGARSSPADLRAALAALAGTFTRTRQEFGSYLKRKAR